MVENLTDHPFELGWALLFWRDTFHAKWVHSLVVEHGLSKGKEIRIIPTFFYFFISNIENLKGPNRKLQWMSTLTNSYYF